MSNISFSPFEEANAETISFSSNSTGVECVKIAKNPHETQKFLSECASKVKKPRTAREVEETNAKVISYRFEQSMVLCCVTESTP